MKPSHTLNVFTAAQPSVYEPSTRPTRAIQGSANGYVGVMVHEELNDVHQPPQGDQDLVGVPRVPLQGRGKTLET